MFVPSRAPSTLIAFCCAIWLGVLLGFDGTAPAPDHARQGANDSFAPADSERVAFLGARQVEGQIETGYFETALIAAFPEKKKL